MLLVDVAKLKRSPGDSARYDLQAELPPLELPGESASFAGLVRAGLEVINTGKTLAVEGVVSGRLRLNCGCCLEPYDYPFEVAVEETYIPASEGGGEEAVPFSGDYLDLTPEVLKSIILTLPMKMVCREECRGLCPQCGRNLNEGMCGCENEDIDPRLSVLKNLFKEKG